MAEGKSTPRVPDLAEALRESEERFRRAFEFAGIGMAILSIDGRWVRVNRALTEMLGYTAAEFQETTFQALTHPNDMEGSVAGSLQVVSGREPIMQMEKRYRHKAGHYVWTRLTTSVVRSPEGEPLHYI
jgi:PAS domain S-box-containing protein